MKFSKGDIKLLSVATIMFAIGIFVFLPAMPSVDEAKEAFVASVAAFGGDDGGGDGGCCDGGDGGDNGNTGGNTGGFGGDDGGGDGGCCDDPDPDPEPDAPDPKPGQPNMKTPVCKSNGTKVTLSWNSVSNADYYPVRIREVGKPATERTSESLSGFSGATSYTFDISPNTQYEWWVHAYDASNSPEERKWSTYTREDFECIHFDKPEQPVMKPPVCKSNGTQVTLSWNSVADADLYPVRIREAGKPSTERPVNDLTGTTYTFDISSNTQYEWWVHTYDGSHSPEEKRWSDSTFVEFECGYNTPTPTPTCDFFNIEEGTVEPGDTLILNWGTSNTNNVKVGRVGGGSLNVNNDATNYQGISAPSLDGTYTYAVYINGVKQNNCTDTVVVEEDVPAPTCIAYVNTTSVPAGGGNVTLTWSSNNVASNAEVFVNGSKYNGAVSNVNGSSLTFFVNVDTKYRVRVSNAAGYDDCEATLVVVDDPTPTPKCDFFNIEEGTVEPGDTLTLNWGTSNTNNVKVGRVGGGSLNVNNDATNYQGISAPSLDGTYTYAVYINGVKQNNCTDTVVVDTPYTSTPTCDFFSITETSVVPNGNLTFNWGTTDVTSTSINNGIGSVTVDGTNRNYSAPSTPGTYIYELTFNGQTSHSCRDTVVVNEIIPPVTCSDVVFTSSATTVAPGAQVGLSWVFTGNVETAVLAGFGSIIGTSGQTVTVNNTTTYTITIGNSVNQVQCPLTVTVVDDPAPICNSFTASPDTVPFGGGNSILAWETTNADSVSISGIGSVSVDGNRSVFVNSETTYILTAVSGSQTATCPVTIGVGNPPAPVCEFFTIAQNVVEPGETLNLSWSTRNASSVSIDRGVGVVSSAGNTTTSAPTTDGTYTYTMTVQGGGQTITCTEMVEVDTPTPAPISCENNVSFVADDYNLPRGGGNVTLTWNTTDLDTVSINGVSSNALDGSELVSVTNDFTYTLTGTKGNDTITCPLSIDVASGGSSGSRSPECELDISDDDIDLGDTVKLTWETRFAREITLEDDNGNILVNSNDDDDFDSNITVKPGEDTEFTLTVERGSKKEVCEVEVEVEDNSVVNVIENRVQPLVAGIALTQVPYTGFDAGPMMTFIFYALLTIWGFFVAYVVAVRNGYVGAVSLARGTLTRNDSYADVSNHGAMLIPTMGHVPAAAPVASVTTAATPVATPMMQTPVAPVIDEEKEQMTMLDNRAHMMKTLISSDAIAVLHETQH